MSSTTIVERPIFKSAEYLRELVRKNKARPSESVPADPNDVPPFLPASAFVTGDDEVIECGLA